MPVAKQVLEELTENKANTVEGLIGLCSYAAHFLLDEDLRRSESSSVHRALAITLVRCGQQLIRDHHVELNDAVLQTLTGADERIRRTRPEDFEEPEVEETPEVVRVSRYDREPVI